jgi:hypothetical protein
MLEIKEMLAIVQSATLARKALEKMRRNASLLLAARSSAPVAEERFELEVTNVHWFSKPWSPTKNRNFFPMLYQSGSSKDRRIVSE